MDPLVEAILRDAEDDWVVIDNVIAYGWEEAGRPGKDPRKATTDLFRSLLERKVLEVGDLGEEGFVPWTCSVDEAVEKFIVGCESHDWETQGALWWLEITKEGTRLVERSERGNAGHPGRSSYPSRIANQCIEDDG